VRNQEEAAKLIQSLNGAQLEGRSISVEIATKKKKKTKAVCLFFFFFSRDFPSSLSNEILLNVGENFQQARATSV
jgi:hypothetical protein